MSKTTKIIAALGVVAGLGVAALPAFTYAAEVAGNVELEVDIAPAIAMTITGNNDEAVANYISLGVLEAGADVEGLYTYDETEDEYTATVSPYEADGRSVYFQKIVGVNVYDQTGAIGTHTGGAQYSSSALQTSGSKVSILPNQLIEGTGTSGEGAQGFGSLITVYTNNGTYSLTVEDNDSDTSLKQEGAGDVPSIPVLSSENTLEAGHSAWGYKAGNDESWLAMPANGANRRTIVDGGAGSTTGAQTTVKYAVSTSATQASGVYKDTILYTATAN